MQRYRKLTKTTVKTLFLRGFELTKIFTVITVKHKMEFQKHHQYRTSNW